VISCPLITRQLWDSVPWFRGTPFPPEWVFWPWLKVLVLTRLFIPQKSRVYNEKAVKVAKRGRAKDLQKKF